MGARWGFSPLRPCAARRRRPGTGPPSARGRPHARHASNWPARAPAACRRGRPAGAGGSPGGSASGRRTSRSRRDRRAPTFEVGRLAGQDREEVPELAAGGAERDHLGVAELPAGVPPLGRLTLVESRSIRGGLEGIPFHEVVAASFRTLESEVVEDGDQALLRNRRRRGHAVSAGSDLCRRESGSRHRDHEASAQSNPR